MADVLRVFGYGSLMFAPECAHALIDVCEGVLDGHRRAFNKQSYVRGCAPGRARWPEMTAPSRFVDNGRRFSLALGSEPGGHMVGRVLTYAADRADDALAALDKREGYIAGAPVEKNGYARRPVPIETDRGTVWALAYLGNPQSELYAPLPPATVARVLIAATPAEGAQKKRGGLEYLLETRRILEQGGITDPMVEELLGHIRQIPGSWQDLLER